MAELKKCPFCGGKAFVDYHKFWDEKTKDFTVKTYGAFCDKCGSNSWQHYRTEEEAIEAWNNRATEAELRANVIDEFAERLKPYLNTYYDRVQTERVAEQMKGEKE